MKFQLPPKHNSEMTAKSTSIGSRIWGNIALIGLFLSLIADCSLFSTRIRLGAIYGLWVFWFALICATLLLSSSRTNDYLYSIFRYLALSDLALKLWSSVSEYSQHNLYVDDHTDFILLTILCLVLTAPEHRNLLSRPRRGEDPTGKAAQAD